MLVTYRQVARFVDPLAQVFAGLEVRNVLARQRHRLASDDGEALGRELTEDDVEHGDGREGDPKRDAMDPHRVRDLQGRQRPFEETRECGLADPAEAQTGERDAELRRRQVTIEVANDVPHRRGARTALAL